MVIYNILQGDNIMGFFGFKKNKKNDKEAAKEEVIQVKSETSKKAADSGNVEKNAPVAKNTKPSTAVKQTAPAVSE